MKKIISIILICILLSSCIASQNYPSTSLSNKHKIYQNVKSKHKNKIKIYLQNSEVAEIAKDYNNKISVSSACHSYDKIYLAEGNKFWKTVEEEAMKLNNDKDSAITFVCSAKDADFIYEYSYEERRDPSAIGNFFWAMTLFTFPTTEKRNYEISLKIKNNNNKLIKDLGDTKFDHTIFISALFIPVQIISKKNLAEENVLAEIILDKVVESINLL